MPDARLHPSTTVAHLLNVWPSVRSKLLAQERALLLFDYDGTLTPIVARPEDALLPVEIRQRLAALAANPRCIVGIVSGRGLTDLLDKVDIPGLVYAGNHGMEISGPGIEFTHPLAVSTRAILRQACSTLTEELQHVPGAVVEDKGLTVTVHYRATPEARVSEVEAAVAETIAKHVDDGQLRQTRGKKVTEVRPNIPWDKGEAIEKIREQYDNHPFPIYFGDDRTDEDGFAVVQRMGGLAVFVGEPREGTVALHQLDSPREVSQTLGLFQEALEREYG